MSRSFKKHNIVKDKVSKDMKKFANKKVRNTPDVPNGKSYKKVFESYDIHDHIDYWSKEMAIKRWETAEPDSWIRTRFETLEKYLIYWEKCVKRK